MGAKPRLDAGKVEEIELICGHEVQESATPQHALARPVEARRPGNNDAERLLQPRQLGLKNLPRETSFDALSVVEFRKGCHDICVCDTWKRCCDRLGCRDAK